MKSINNLFYQQIKEKNSKCFFQQIPKRHFIQLNGQSFKKIKKKKKKLWKPGRKLPKYDKDHL